MKKLLQQVRRFHHAFEVPVSPTPRISSAARRALRMRILSKEFEEYAAAERADGKVIKPQGWEPPDIAAVLAPQEADV